MSIIVDILCDRKCCHVEVYEEDTWCTFCDKVSEIVLDDIHKSSITGHYNHEMYYLLYVSKTGSIGKIGKCSTVGSPYDMIDNTHIVKVMFALKAIRCCKCYVIHRDECISCHLSNLVRDERGSLLVHNLYCGHELFCRKCADEANEMHFDRCPICYTLDFRLVHGSGKCYKCHQFRHSPTCELADQNST